MAESLTLEQIVKLAEQLSPVDKARLIERVAPQITRELEGQPDQPRRSLRGIWRPLDTPGEVIDEMRQEAWSTFPRADV